MSPAPAAARRVLIVTGASRGIGAATARLAATRGYAVCINYKGNHAAARDVLLDIEAAGGEAMLVAADVSSESEVLRLFETVDRELGPLDALVNNVGVLETQMRLDQMDAARIARVVNTNILSALLCARESVRRMSTLHGGRGGAIVNVSSAAARLGSPNEYIDYAASKGAIDTLTIGLSCEVAGEGIRVNAVRPGIIETDIHTDGGEPGRVARLAGSVPMQRGGKPEEVAAGILWLLSDEASYTTGTFLDMAGGR